MHHNLHLSGHRAHTLRLAHHGFKFADHFSDEELTQRRALSELTAGIGRSRHKDATQGMIGAGDSLLSVKRQHARGNTFQDGFHMPAPLL